MKGKAFYNLLKLKWEHDKDVAIEPWQIEDLRGLLDEALFDRFAKLDIVLTKETFMLYVEKCDSPEELVECFLISKKDDSLVGRAYLLTFEAWRRFCQDKQTVSTFCDELDYLISAYDKDQLEDDGALYEQLFELCVLLDQHIDAGGEAKEINEWLQTWCAHDIEIFMYEYIATLIDEEQDAAASELLEAFFSYATDQAWFDFLRIRLLAKADLAESKVMLEHIFSELVEKPDVDLGLEMLRFLTLIDEPSAFKILLDQISSWMHTEGDFKQLLEAVRDHFCALDQEKEEAYLASLIKNRLAIDPSAIFYPTDKELQTIKQLVNKAQF